MKRILYILLGALLYIVGLMHIANGDELIYRSVLEIIVGITLIIIYLYDDGK